MMQTLPLHHFAILAPIPLEHLETGAPVSAGTGYVAFGTAKWEFFRKIDEQREGAAVPALIYPSDSGGMNLSNPKVSWWGWYVGHSESNGGAHQNGMLHRPPSTAAYSADNAGHWAIFWHVAGLRRLAVAKHLPIGKIPTVKGGWRKNAPPRGPELVALPESLGDET